MVSQGIVEEGYEEQEFKGKLQEAVRGGMKPEVEIRGVESTRFNPSTNQSC